MPPCLDACSRKPDSVWYNTPNRVHRFKLARAKEIARSLAWVPFVSLIAVINSVALGTAKKNSDIDFLIVTRKNRLWLVRTLVVPWLWFRKYKKNKITRTDRACLGFWVAEDALNFSSLQIAMPPTKQTDMPPSSERQARDADILSIPRDVYFLYWMAHITPILDRGGYAQVLRANQWVNQALPYWTKGTPYQSGTVPPKGNLHKAHVVAMLWHGFCDAVDWVLYYIHKFRLAQFPENQRLPSPSVVITRSMLKLHPYDKRFALQKAFEKKLGRIVPGLRKKETLPWE